MIALTAICDMHLFLLSAGPLTYYLKIRYTLLQMFDSNEQPNTGERAVRTEELFAVLAARQQTEQQPVDEYGLDTFAITAASRAYTHRAHVARDIITPLMSDDMDLWQDQIDKLVRVDLEAGLVAFDEMDMKDAEKTKTDLVVSAMEMYRDHYEKITTVLNTQTALDGPKRLQLVSARLYFGRMMETSWHEKIRGATPIATMRLKAKMAAWLNVPSLLQDERAYLQTVFRK
jgi:hypothetical protein